MSGKMRCWSRFYIAVSVAIPLSLGFGIEVRSQDGKWKIFSNDADFTIAFPSSWTPVGNDMNMRLDIMDSAIRVKAVVIPKGASEITFEELLPPPAQLPFPEYLQEYYQTKIYNYRTVRLEAQEAESACGVVDIGYWDFDVAPDVFQTTEAFICRVGARWFELRLTRWKSDGSSAKAEEIALEMIKSLRVLRLTAKHK